MGGYQEEEYTEQIVVHSEPRALESPLQKESINNAQKNDTVKRRRMFIKRDYNSLEEDQDNNRLIYQVKKAIKAAKTEEEPELVKLLSQYKKESTYKPKEEKKF